MKMYGTAQVLNAMTKYSFYLFLPIVAILVVLLGCSVLYFFFGISPKSMAYPVALIFVLGIGFYIGKR